MGHAGSAESRNNRLKTENNVILTGRRSSLVTQQENRSAHSPLMEIDMEEEKGRTGRRL